MQYHIQLYFVMSVFVFLVVLGFFQLRAEAEKMKEIPSVIPEIHRREESCKCSDITPLLNKLIHDLEDMKGQIINEMPEQLQKQATKIEKIAKDLENVKETSVKQTVSAAKQAEETKKMAKALEEHTNKTDKAIVKITTDLDDIKGKSTKETEEIKTNQQYLKRIEASVENASSRDRQISESLQLHDERLQSLVNKSSCKAPETLPRDCTDIKRMGSKSNGAYRIYLNNNNTPREVYCDFTTPGGDWLVFQRRRDGSVDFYRNWTSYADGFGNVNGEFWLGNEILHQLTSNRRYKLRIDLEDFQNQKRYAEYSTFSIGPSSDYYRLRIGNYSGDAGDSLSYHNNQQFSAYDVDRDANGGGSCAEMYHGAWWYISCHASNLNGRYLRGEHKSYADGVNWKHWRGYYYSLKTTEMKIALLN